MKKSLKNNFGFLKNSHRPLKIGAAARRPQKKFPKKMFQIVRLTNLGKVMASWGLFKAPFKRYREKTSGLVGLTVDIYFKNNECLLFPHG